MREHIATAALLVFASSVVSGCFTRDEPFYDGTQVLQDTRLEGGYHNTGMEGQNDGSSWFIAASQDFPGKYEVSIQERAASVRLLATLFRVDTTLFLDLYPLTDSGVDHVGGAVTVTEAIRGAMYKPLHVVWKVELDDTGLNYSFPFGNGVAAALKQAPELRGEPAGENARIMVPGTPKQAQEFLRKFKDDTSVFNYKGRLVKKKDRAQPNDGGQPSIAPPVSPDEP